MKKEFERNRATGARVSMREISRIAGVNQSTVSRILTGSSDKYKYADETIRRVKQIAESLGYRPNRLVHGVFTGKTFAAGVIIPAGDFYGRILQGVHDTLLEQRYACILGWNRQDREEPGSSVQERLLQQMLEHRVDGIVFRPTIDEAQDSEFAGLHNAGVPLVAVDREIPYVKADFVGSDDIVGGRIALEHLADLGHTEIAHIAAPFNVSAIAHRRQGFLDAAIGRGCRVQTIPATNNDIGAKLAPIFSRAERPTAVFCEMDNHLPAIYTAAREAGLSIPSDLSVIGYGNLTLRGYLDPAPVSIDQNPYQVGVRAAQILLDRIGEAEPASAPIREYIPTAFVDGESTAAPAP